MGNQKRSYTDIVDRAAAELKQSINKPTASSNTPKITVAEAMRAAPITVRDDTRDVVRVFFISTDTELLSPIKQTLDGYLDVATVFDEVHILVMRTGIAPLRSVLRPQPNVFLYTVAARSAWQLPGLAMSMIKNQLSFANGFRPDLVVARDPFLSAITALWVRYLYKRPLQLHILTDISDATAARQQGVGWWQRRIALFLLRYFSSIRVKTARMCNFVRKISAAPDLARLPQYNPYEIVAHQKNTIDLHTEYPQYSFFILYTGALDDAAGAIVALRASQDMLKNTRVAMLVIGRGQGLFECRKFVRQAGIARQVIFKPDVIDCAPYLKSANLLILPEQTSASEDLAMQAAVAGIPMVATRTENRADLFPHGVAAYLCDLGDINQFAAGVKELMEDFSFRQTLIERARLQVRSHRTQNKSSYQNAYQASVEKALFYDETFDINTQIATEEVETNSDFS